MSEAERETQQAEQPGQQPQPITHVVVNVQTYNAVLQYLYQKPFAEVLGLVQALQACVNQPGGLPNENR